MGTRTLLQFLVSENSVNDLLSPFSDPALAIDPRNSCYPNQRPERLPLRPTYISRLVTHRKRLHSWRRTSLRAVLGSVHIPLSSEPGLRKE